MIKPAITLTVLLAAGAAYAQDEPAPKTTSAPAASADDAIADGLAEYKKRRFAKAAGEFEKAVDANPQSAAAHYYLGYAIYKTAEPKRGFHPDKQKAAAEFAKAYELDPEFKPDWGKTNAVAKSK
jgi:tetratricopeptide (TPR) repeat protein